MANDNKGKMKRKYCCKTGSLDGVQLWESSDGNLWCVYCRPKPIDVLSRKNFKTERKYLEFIRDYNKNEAEIHQKIANCHYSEASRHGELADSHFSEAESDNRNIAKLWRQ